MVLSRQTSRRLQGHAGISPIICFTYLIVFVSSFNSQILRIVEKTHTFSKESQLFGRLVLSFLHYLFFSHYRIHINHGLSFLPAINFCHFRHFPFQLTSQHPYMETFVGKPHVYTIDINDLELVESTLKEILSSEVSLSFGSEI